MTQQSALNKGGGRGNRGGSGASRLEQTGVSESQKKLHPAESVMRCL